MNNLLKNRLIRALAAVIAVAVAASCGQVNSVKDDIAPEMVINANPVDAAGGSQYVYITASSQWTVTVECSPEGDWARVSPASGSGNADIVLTVDANEGLSSRTAQITLAGGSWFRTTTLTQRGAKPSEGGDDDDNRKYDGGGPLTQTGWLELPALTTPQGSSQLDFFYHNMEIDSKKVRNYSYAWDYDNLVASWVAYPLNKNQRNGSAGYTKHWSFDPCLPTDKQPQLFSGFKGGYDRGHQIPSADRQKNPKSNRKTFYFTNMTPQIGENFNQSIWANLETMVRSWANNSDTLYVVTGCVTTGSQDYALDNVGKKVTVPTAYYKALLRYSNAKTIGKKGYVACAFWLDHKEYSDITITKSYMLSIDELEDRLGIDFFVNLPALIGDDDAAAVEAEDPAQQPWWNVK